MIGLLGGGQLGRMMIQSAHQLGQKVALLDADALGPAAQLADEMIVADYQDFAALSALARQASVFTTEFENVPAESLRFLARHGPTRPAPEAVAIAQNRIDEKRFIAGVGVPVAPHVVMLRAEDCLEVPEALFPGILKSARMGYDGKGQATVHSIEALSKAWQALGGVPAVFEKRLPLEREISVICARDAHGAIAVFPVGENTHCKGILSVTQVPARISESLAQRARDAAREIIEALDYVGVLCVEFFVLSGDRLVANEMAPRPHNSGHYTIEACTTSQFEQQVRICVDLPLGTTELRRPAVMLNVLGDAWFRGAATPSEPDWPAVYAVRDAHVHLYGKSEPRRGRKMAHVTCLGDTLDQARQRAAIVAGILGLDVGNALQSA